MFTTNYQHLNRQIYAHDKIENEILVKIFVCQSSTFKQHIYLNINTLQHHTYLTQIFSSSKPILAGIFSLPGSPSK